MRGRLLIALVCLTACGGLTSHGSGGGGGSTGGGTGVGGGSSTGGGTGTGGGGGTGGGTGGGVGGGSATGGGSGTNCNHAVGDGHHLTAPVDHPFVGVRSMAFDAQGNLYVLCNQYSAKKAWISLFAAGTHTFLTSIGDGELKQGWDFALAPTGEVYAVNFDPTVDPSPTVVHFDAIGGKVDSWLTNADEGVGIFYDTDGTLLYSSNWLYRFSLTGTLMGGPYGSIGANDPPYYAQMARDASGTLWAAESADNQMVSFDSAMTRLGAFGSRGAGPGQFDGTGTTHEAPERFAFTANGQFYVSDPLNSRLMRLDNSGTMLASFDFGGSTEVGAVAIDPLSGNLYVGRTNGVDVLCPF